MCQSFSFFVSTDQHFRMTEKSNSHLVFLLLMTSWFHKDKECASHVVFMFLMTSPVTRDVFLIVFQILVFKKFLNFLELKITTVIFHSENLVTVFKISKNTSFEPEICKKWYFCPKGCIHRGTLCKVNRFTVLIKLFIRTI